MNPKTWKIGDKYRTPEGSVFRVMNVSSEGWASLKMLEPVAVERQTKQRHVPATWTPLLTFDQSDLRIILGAVQKIADERYKQILAVAQPLPFTNKRVVDLKDLGDIMFGDLLAEVTRELNK